MSDPTAATMSPAPLRAWWAIPIQWIDNHANGGQDPSEDERLDWLRVVPFIILHLACLTPIFFGVSWAAVGWAVLLYVVRMFGITGAYHRYFSHRTYRLNRFWQFCFAVLGNSAGQRGPLWWAAHHRHHHRHSDEEIDLHSPMQHGFWWSHMAWFLSRSNYRTQIELVPDLAKFPELRMLDRFDVVLPIALGFASYGLGELLAATGYATSGLQFAAFWVISTVVTAHATFTINSLCHVWGKRRYATDDTSRNNFWLALLTLGEGWHNNHHHYQSAARQGFRWWEVDITYYALVGLSWVGIVRDMKPVPEQVVEQGKLAPATGP